MRIVIPSLSLLLAAVLAAAPAAQTITGRIVSSTGVGVPGVNIDGFDVNDDEIDLANDGTDANGNFTTTVLSGAGVYRFVFYPPAPPQTTHLVGERINVVVVTTTNLGTITLGAGVLVSGRAVRTGGIPVPNVLLEVIDGPTGLPVTQVQTKTNAFGNFNLAVPPHECELRLDTTSQLLVLGSRFFELDPAGPVALGDVHLPPGAVVTGHVQRANGTAVAGVDLDFDKVSSGNGVYVPNDNTNALGNFSVVVALNTYDISFCPNSADLLVSHLIAGRAITGTTNLGTIVLGGGVRLFGTVLDPHGSPASQADVDVFVHATGAPVPLCNDNTIASGAYSVVVPTGTFDVVFTAAAAGAALGGDWHHSVVVAADTQLNGMLPLHGRGNSYSGAPPSGGIVVAPLAAGGRLGRPLGAQAPGTAPIELFAEEGEFVVRGLAPGTRALLLLGTLEGVRTLALPVADAAGRAGLSLRALGTQSAWLRVVAGERRGVSAAYRMQSVFGR